MTFFIDEKINKTHATKAENEVPVSICAAELSKEELICR